MSCPFDWKDYVFGEPAEGERRQADLHLKSCSGCREEFERLRATQSALLALRDEEIPQRIGFVSDRVYEPSALRRWWAAFWTSAPRLGFASAAMLSVAILVSAMNRPAPAPQPAPAVDMVKLQAEISRQVNEAVVKAVAETEARNREESARLLVAAERRFAGKLREDRLIAERNMELTQRFALRDVRMALFPEGTR
jgi:anti-sigma factor RsiW